MTSLFDNASWLYLSFVPDPESGGICAGEPMGMMLTREQGQELIEGLTKFFASHSDEEIDRYNRDTVAKQKAWYSAQMATQSRASGGFVYLLRAENGLFKIGKAKNLSARFQPFSVSFPMEWELIYSFHSRNYSKAETELHERFATKRVRGEWFRLTPEDVAHIKVIQDDSL